MTTQILRLLLHSGVAVMLESSHIRTYTPVLRFSRLAIKQTPEYLGSQAP